MLNWKKTYGVVFQLPPVTTFRLEILFINEAFIHNIVDYKGRYFESLQDEKFKTEIFRNPGFKIEKNKFLKSSLFS